MVVKVFSFSFPGSIFVDDHFSFPVFIFLFCLFSVISFDTFAAFFFSATSLSYQYSFATFRICGPKASSVRIHPLLICVIILFFFCYSPGAKEPCAFVIFVVYGVCGSFFLCSLLMSLMKGYFSITILLYKK